MLGIATFVDGMMQMTIVKVVNVAVMSDLGMSTRRSMDMIMSVMHEVGQRNGTVMVAMVPVEMVKGTIDEVVEMVAMRNSRVTAAVSVNVAILVAAILVFNATSRVGAADSNDMFIHMSVVKAMKMVIVKKASVALVDDLSMAAIGTVGVFAVVCMSVAYNIDFAMKVAVPVVLMMKVAINQETVVVTMRDFRMATLSTVNMAHIMPIRTGMTIGAFHCGVGFEFVRIHMVEMVAMKTIVVQISNVVVVLHFLVSTVVAMYVAIV